MENISENKFGVFCGRCNPVHAGHEAVINKMMEIYPVENIRVIIGSANNPQSLRHFFSYKERRDFIKKLYPGIVVLPLGDFPLSDDEWMIALDDLLESSNMNIEQTTFFGGCEEDISFFLSRDRKTHILNRFDGSTPKISATEIRDSLIHQRPIDKFINPKIEEDVRRIFRIKWTEFKNK